MATCDAVNSAIRDAVPVNILAFIYCTYTHGTVSLAQPAINRPHAECLCMLYGYNARFVLTAVAVLMPFAGGPYFRVRRSLKTSEAPKKLSP